MKRLIITLAALSIISPAALCGPSVKTSGDIDALMSRMTLEEKIGQMNQLVGPKLTGIAANKNLVESEFCKLLY